MSNEPRKPGVKVEPLELNKETIADLSDDEAEKVEGGRAPANNCGTDTDTQGPKFQIIAE